MSFCVIIKEKTERNDVYLGNKIERAKELKGKGGYIYGSAAYIVYLNKLFYLRKMILSGDTDTNYYEAMKRKNNEVNKTVTAILTDLKSNLHCIHLMPKNMRTQLIEFLKGLKGYLSFTNTTNSDIEKAVRILNLKESKTGYQSRASERELKEAAKTICNGSRKNNLSKVVRKELLKKLQNDTVKRVTGADLSKIAFVAELLGKQKETKEFFHDVKTLYEYLYENRESFKGKEGKNMCSIEYINYYEKKIFPDTSFKSHMSSKYNYYSFIWANLQGIANAVVKDLMQGTVGKNYIEEKYWVKLDNWVNQLRKIKIPASDYEKNVKNFKLPNVTGKLFELMRKGEADGNKLREEYPFNIIERGRKFTKKVGAKSEYDLKSQGDWNSSWYYFDGYVLRFDDPGNIVYGIVLKSTFKDIGGLNEFVGHVGAGGAQILDNIINPMFPEREIKAPPRELLYNPYYLRGRSIMTEIDAKPVLENAIPVLKNIFTLFDDPRDYNAVELGYKYYKYGRYKK